MDCREFQRLAADIARGQPATDSAARRARAHAHDCERCAARLAAEESLAASFAALRERDAGLEPPARLEALLLEELEKTAARKPVPMVSRPRWGWRVAAAAAAIAIGVWLVALRQPQAQHGGAEDRAAGTIRDLAEPGAPETPELAKAPDASSETKSEIVATESADRVAVAKPVRQAQQARSNQHESVEPIWIEMPPAVEDAVAQPVAPSRREIATDFVPLTSAWMSPASHARLVRVRLPSTALLYFGLPGGTSAATVEADVVLGEDGVAHAVRFVGPVLVTASAE